MQNSYKWFSNTDCQYYPCHTEKEINCLFCYCPLYPLLTCPGTPKFTEAGVKDCSECGWVHTPEAYDVVVALLKA